MKKLLALLIITLVSFNSVQADDAVTTETSESVLIHTEKTTTESQAEAAPAAAPEAQATPSAEPEVHSTTTTTTTTTTAEEDDEWESLDADDNAPADESDENDEE